MATNCKYCGKKMQVSFRQKVFCSKECSKAYYNRKGRINKECQICGSALTGRQRSYCSSECRIQAIKKQKAEYRKVYDVQFKKPQDTIPKREKSKESLSLEEAAKLAKAEGISWGEYYTKHRLWEREM